MAKSKKQLETEAQQEINRKQERLRKRERDQHRTLYVGVGIGVGLALLFLVFGIVYELVIRPNSTVATVGSDKIVAQDFWKRARLEQSSLQNALLFYQEREQQFGNQGIFTQQINQIQSTLASPFSLGQQTVDQMVQDILVQREAEKRGITVTDAEVEEELRAQVANNQGLVTQAQATATLEAWANATATAALWTPTPAATATLTTSAALSDTARLSDTTALTDSAAITVSPALTPAATPEPLPTPAIISDTAFTTGLEALAANVKTSSGMSLDEYRRVIRNRLLADKVSEAIGAELVPDTQAEVRASHILIRPIDPTPTATAVPEGQPAPEPTPTATPLPAGAPTPTATPAPRTRAEALAIAKDVRKQLDNGGDFAALAAQYSDDTSNKDQGGELGWFARNAMVEPFASTAFSLPVGSISDPISTTFGYHIINVEEKDPARPVDPNTLSQQRSQAFQTWLQEQVAAANVLRNDVAGNLPRELQ